jgi:hypothetical protein|tara:strand:- start:3647 stop:3922 length:276 start_codon:yes stop_codon:yes gene_type:complete
MSNHIISKLKMIEAGIVPAFTGDELKKMLESMPIKERRIAQRKFRKIWRKLAKEDHALESLMTSGRGVSPSKSEKRNRAVLVLSELFIKSK